MGGTHAPRRERQRELVTHAPRGVRETDRVCKRVKLTCICGTHVIIKSKTTFNLAVSVFLCSPHPRRSDVRGTGNISNATTQSLPETTMTTNDDDSGTEGAGMAQCPHCYVVKTGTD